MTQRSSEFMTVSPLIPANEADRLSALHRYRILDTPPEIAFDRITALAARLFKMPIALISLVDESRAWFKSCVGFGASEVPRDATLCSFAVLSDEPLIIPDTRLDDRFACNPFVQSEPGVRFYAGAPLLSHDGFNLGTLCLLDSQPRDQLTSEQEATLVDLAAMVVDELELRLAAYKITQVDTALLEITQGVSKVTGEAFFEALVQHFAKVLDTDYAYIGLIKGDEPKLMSTIATCAHGQIVDNLEYLLCDTPCWEVIEQRKICCYPRNVQDHFPNAPLLKPLSIESYVAIPFFDSDGVPSGLLGVMDGEPLENVQLAETLLTIFAQRIATELERQQTEQTRDRFLAVGSDVQVITKTNGYFQWVSPTSERLLGWTPEEMISRPWTDFIHTDDLNPSVSEADRLFLAFENRYRHKDGSYRWLRWRAQLHSEEQVLYATAVDITAAKHLEAERTQAEERYRTLFESIDEGFCIIEVLFDQNNVAVDYRFLEVNPAFEQQSGLKQAVGKTMRQIVPNLEEYWFEVYGKVVLTGESVRLENRAEELNRWFDVYAFRIEQPENRKVAILFKDVTDRKQIEIDREQLLVLEQAAREEADRANRIKDEFLAVLSHELRSPLNPILGWSRILQAGTLDAAKTKQALATIERNAKLQSELIEDLLDVSRILQGKLRLTVSPVNLSTIVQAAIETVRLAAEAKSIQIEATFDAEVGQVLGDATRLQQVIWNLLSNAVKFTPVGGRVEVRLGQATDHGLIIVSDNGKGIEPDFLPYVFDYFRQEDGATTRKFGGLGLGLAIVRHLVELHGGTVLVDSEGEGLGATFTVKLPLMPTQPLIHFARRDSEALLNLDSVRILVIDDEVDSREFVAFVLEQSGAIVTTAATAGEGFLALAQSPPDVLVSDIGMPDMDGYMLMQQVRALPPDQGGAVKAIALTAYAGDFNQQQALQAGFQRHLAKPIDPQDLIKTISTLIA
ncbi:MAG: hypothetical protein C4288_01360 [Leptolyngbya sp. ERB_1_1]